MNYHLNRQGHNLGEFPLEELHRRRVAGELNGTELVWCEGMVQWQSLDVVLQQKLPGALRLPRAVEPKPKTNRIVLAVVGVVLLLFVCGLVFLGIAVARYAPKINRTIAQIKNQAAAATPAPTPAPPAGPSALSLASQPVLWPTNAVTATDIRARNREFRLRQYVEGYKLRGERNPANDALCLGLLQNWVAANFGGSYDTNLPSLVELSDQLANDPNCTDPIVQMAVALNNPDSFILLKRLDRAVQGFRRSGHRGYPKFYANMTLTTKLIDRGLPSKSVAVSDSYSLEFLREALRDGSIQPGDQEEIGEMFVLSYGHEFFVRNQKAVCSIFHQQGEPFRWLALVLHGESEINEAWRLRGGGYIDKVTPQGAEGFGTHLDLAAADLTQAWRLEPKWPLAPCRMIYVSLGNSGLEDMRLWFDRTEAARVDVDRAWSDFAWGLRPRWYGDVDAMLAFGVTALNTRHFETDVPRKYFDAVSGVEQELATPVGRHIYAREDIWPNLQAMCEGYIAEPTHPERQAGWRSNYATLAFLAGKYDVAARQLTALNWQLGTRNLGASNVDLSLMPLEVAARTGEQSNAVAAAEISRNAGDISTALKQYRELATTDLDDRTRSFVRERLASLEIESRLQSHAWVDYMPTDTNFIGWCVQEGKWILNPDGSLEPHLGENGHLLYSRARIGRDFEVRGEFEVEHSSAREFQGGLVMGLPLKGTVDWYSFRMVRGPSGSDYASFERHWARGGLQAPVPLDSFTNTFYVRYQDGRLTATVNNQVVFKEAAPTREISVATNEFFLGLGAFYVPNDTVIRYRNVQARSLTAGADAK